MQHAGSLLKIQQEAIAQEAGDNEEFLQTRTIPTTTAMQELELWRESLSDEVNNLISELQVVERTTEQQLAEMAKLPDAPALERVPISRILEKESKSTLIYIHIYIYIYYEIIYNMIHFHNHSYIDIK